MQYYGLVYYIVGLIFRFIVDFEKLEHGCRMMCTGFPLSLVWGWRMVMFHLSGFYCMLGKIMLAFCNIFCVWVPGAFGVMVCSYWGNPVSVTKSL